MIKLDISGPDPVVLEGVSHPSPSFTIRTLHILPDTRDNKNIRRKKKHFYATYTKIRLHPVKYGTNPNFSHQQIKNMLANLANDKTGYE